MDLGTTYTSVGVWRNGPVEIIADAKGRRTTPCCVSFTESKRFVGDAAKTQFVFNSANTIYGVKRLIGKSVDDESVQKDMKIWPYKVVAGHTDNGKKPMIVVCHKGEEKQYSPEEISGMMLRKMKGIAASDVGLKVKNAVLTVPAYFNHSQRQATKDAAHLAGLHLIDEPIAAVVAYAFSKKRTPSNFAENVQIFDFGGETLDLSLLTINKDIFEIKAVGGDSYLGGNAFIHVMVSHFIGEFEREHGKDISGERQALVRLRTACERAKRELSWSTKTIIKIDGLSESIDFFSVITRSLFAKLNAKLFEKCMSCVKKCVEDGKMRMSDVHRVVLVGGSSKIPKVQQMLQESFKRVESVRGINPDEAVAYGAIIFSQMLTGKKAVGIEVYVGGMSVVIPNQTALPIKKMMEYITPLDNTVKLTFTVCECVKFKFIAQENEFLDEFILTDIPSAPDGTRKFDVVSKCNNTKLLTVSVQYQETTNTMQITITTYRLFWIDLQRIIKCAKRNRLINLTTLQALC